MNNIKKLATKENLFLLILIIWLGSVVLPVIIACGYAVPSEDDFNNYVNWPNGGTNLLFSMLQRVKDVYFSWQGAYFGLFILYFPYFRLLGVTGYRGFLLIIATLFFIGFILLVKEGCYWLDIKEKNKAVATIILSAIMLLFLITGDYENEVFYWLSGACVYTAPLALSMLCVACYIAYERKHSNGLLAIGCILAIMGVGGQPNVCAVACALLLFLISYDFFIRKTKSKNFLIWAFALAGSIVNVAAPGNFRRSTYFTDDGLHPITITKAWVTHFLSTVYQDFQSGFLLIVLIAVFMLVYELCKESTFEFKYPGLVTLYAFFGIFITDFPVFLGYNNSGDSFYWPSRVAFVERFAIIVFFSLCVAYWGGYCAQKRLFSLNKEHYIIVALMIVISLSSVDIINLGSYKMLYHLAKGDYAAVAESEMDMLRQIEESDGGDVVVYYKAPAEGTWTNLKRIGLYSYVETTGGINTSVANFYGVNSVYVVPAEAETIEE